MKNLKYLVMQTDLKIAKVVYKGCLSDLVFHT